MSTITTFGPSPSQAISTSPAPNGGGSDQSAAVQAWMNSLVSGPQGVIQPGVYGISTTITQPSLTNILCAYGATFRWIGAANGNLYQMGVNGGAACVRSILNGLTLDYNNGGSGIAFGTYSLQNCRADDIEIRNIPGGYGWRLSADATSGGISDFGNLNCAGNHFGRIYIYNAFISTFWHGASSVAVVTNNELELLYQQGVINTGFLFDQWADNNTFERVESYLTANNAKGLVLNNGGADQGVYSNVFDHYSIDAPSLTGCTAVSLGPQTSLPFANRINHLHCSPSPFSGAGTLLQVTGSPNYDLFFATETPPYRAIAGPHADVLSGPAPTATSLTNNGTTGTATVSADSTDRRGTLTFTPGGTGIAGGFVARVNFASTYLNVPRVLFVPITNATAGLAISIQAQAVGSFTINCGNAPASGTAYQLQYFVVD